MESFDAGIEADDELSCCCDTDTFLEGVATHQHDKDAQIEAIRAGKKRPCLREVRRRRSEALSLKTKPKLIQQRWKAAIRKAQSQEDPWSDFSVADIPTETAYRYRFTSVRNEWVKDIVLVKMEKTSFNQGALRECFRLKKLSNFVQEDDWEKASNYVSKRYMEPVERDVYFEDVHLQMDAKLWGEEYNRCNPVKKVDIFQMSVLEFFEREESPLYHLEHFIEGDYRKYNSNSGFVDDMCRNTPQAFSHFTFERSGHALIVVDIQGVGDLYTDPQIHTANMQGYGDGNLGPRGMALFFHSHQCNRLCKALKLVPFDLAPSEMEERERELSSGFCSESGTVARVKEDSGLPLSSSLPEFPGLHSALAVLARNASAGDSVSPPSADSGLGPDENLDDSPTEGHVPRNRFRFASGSEQRQDSARIAFSKKMAEQHRPSAVNDAANSAQTVLANIHREQACLHVSGRFLIKKDTNRIDWTAVVFHLEKAASAGCLEAISEMARLSLGLPVDIFNDCPHTSDWENPTQGLIYLTQAARCGDRTSIIAAARIYDTGTGPGGLTVEQDWSVAQNFYRTSLETGDLVVGCVMPATDEADYMVQARLGEMLAEGGHGLQRDPAAASELYTEAAEGATNAMKGRLAAKYYELAETLAYEEE